MRGGATPEYEDKWIAFENGIARFCMNEIGGSARALSEKNTDKKTTRIIRRPRFRYRRQNKAHQSSG